MITHIDKLTSWGNLDWLQTNYTVINATTDKVLTGNNGLSTLSYGDPDLSWLVAKAVPATGSNIIVSGQRISSLNSTSLSGIINIGLLANLTSTSCDLVFGIAIHPDMLRVYYTDINHDIKLIGEVKSPWLKEPSFYLTYEYNTESGRLSIYINNVLQCVLGTTLPVANDPLHCMVTGALNATLSQESENYSDSFNLVQNTSMHANYTTSDFYISDLERIGAPIFERIPILEYSGDLYVTNYTDTVPTVLNGSPDQNTVSGSGGSLALESSATSIRILGTANPSTGEPCNITINGTSATLHQANTCVQVSGPTSAIVLDFNEV